MSSFARFHKKVACIIWMPTQVLLKEKIICTVKATEKEDDFMARGKWFDHLQNVLLQNSLFFSTSGLTKKKMNL